MENDRKIAVLIDADNVSPKYIKYIIDELANHGTPTYKRIYGDWTKPQLGNWKEVLLEYSITPIQQYSYTFGKNATDSALIIDAMDILYSKSVNGFCIVSSDSDFTRLAARLREAGMYVIGMGEKKTPKSFISACEKFKYLEALSSAQALAVDSQTQESEREADRISEKPLIKAGDDLKELTQSIRNIIMEISDEDGWVFMGDLGNMLNKRRPDFDTRNYGFAKLTPLVESLNAFEIDSRRTSNPHIVHKFVRIKKAASKKQANSSKKQNKKPS